MKRGFPAFLIFLLIGTAADAALKLDSQIIGRRDNTPGMYLRVIVTSQADHKLSFDMTLKDPYSKSNIDILDQEIEAGREKIFNLAIPLVKSPMVEVRDSDGERAAAGSSWIVREFLNICELEEWASEKQLQDFSTNNRLAANNVSQLEPRMLPDNWLCYTPFRGVFVRESAFNSLNEAERNALVSWVDSGGILTIYGSDRNEIVTSMLGTIVYQASHPIKDGLQNHNQGDLAWYYSNISMKQFPYSVKKTAGKLGGFLLATLFLIVAGPLNYSYFWKRKKIRMILVSLPLISIAFCFLIILYFIMSQGFAKKGGSYSLSVHEEKRDAGFTFAFHSLFSGLYPLGGFKFDRTTAFIPIGKSANFTMDATKNLHLKSGLFTPSINFYYFTAAPFKTREKLIHDPRENIVTNGFEKNILALVFQDGAVLFEARDIAPGEKKKMTRLDEKNILSAFNSLALDSGEKDFQSSVLGGLLNPLSSRGRIRYILRFKDNIASVQTGTKIRAKRNCALLVGIE